MERYRGSPFKKRPNPRFNKGGNKRGKFEDEESSEAHVSETVFRILCQSRRIGSVIGKAGSVVKALREETQAKITVAEAVPGSEERVIIIFSPSAKSCVKRENDDDNDLELHCAAQDALVKVHDRIVEEDIFDDEESVVFCRMLVPNNTVGCLLGKGGEVIKRLRGETGAVIRLLPADQLPTCAMETDELLQISGTPDVTRKALAKVSTLLHQNPRKDEPPSNSRPIGGPPRPFHPGAPPPPERGPYTYGAPPLPWRGYGNEPPPRYAAPIEETPIEFPMKILCSEAKIHGVIGRNGISLRQFQQETGTSVHVDDPIVGSDERVILVSSFDALQKPRSRTIDAILLLQDKTSEHDDKGMITTRVLIPSSKVGCILGQGGMIINEMRRRIKADIRVYAKEEKPKCAGEHEELVQVSGSFGVAKEALAEISSRFRARYLRDTKPGTEPVGPPHHGGRGGGYDPFKGREYHQPPPSYAPPPPPREYQPQPYHPPPVEYATTHAYSLPPHASGYPGAVDMSAANSGQVVPGPPGVHNPTAADVSVKQDPYAGLEAYQAYGATAGGQASTYPESYANATSTTTQQQDPYSISSSGITSSTHASSYYTLTNTATTVPAYPTQQGHYTTTTTQQYGH